MVKNPFLRKITALRYQYGDSAADYFSNNPVCERCDQDRIAALTLHHRRGKSVDDFETLCFNCHMLEHSSSPEYTHLDYLRKIESKRQLSEKREMRNRAILQMVMERPEWSLRKIAKSFGTSHITVRNVIKAAA